MRHDGISVESSWEILIFNRIEVWVCFFSPFIRSIFPNFSGELLSRFESYRTITRTSWNWIENYRWYGDTHPRCIVKTWWMAQLNAIKINKFSRFREIPKHRIQVKWSKFALNARADAADTLLHNHHSVEILAMVMRFIPCFSFFSDLLCYAARTFFVCVLFGFDILPLAITNILIYSPTIQIYGKYVVRCAYSLNCMKSNNRCHAFNAMN